MTFVKLHSLFWFQNPTPSSDLDFGELIEPSPVPFTFNTIGWKVVGVLLIVLIALLLYKGYKAYQKKQYLRTAVAEIKSLQAQSDLSAEAFINTVLFLLKDTAIQSYGRQTVAGLFGREWLTFLDSKVKNSGFIDDEVIILNAVYKQQLPDNQVFNKTQFTNKSIHWIEHHAR